MSSDTEARAFVARWSASRAHERAVYQQFFMELCDLLGVERPDPAADKQQDYCFDRALRMIDPDGAEKTGYIDFYKRGDHGRGSAWATAATR